MQISWVKIKLFIRAYISTHKHICNIVLNITLFNHRQRKTGAKRNSSLAKKWKNKQTQTLTCCFWENSFLQKWMSHCRQSIAVRRRHLCEISFTWHAKLLWICFTVIVDEIVHHLCMLAPFFINCDFLPAWHVVGRFQLLLWWSGLLSHKSMVYNHWPKRLPPYPIFKMQCWWTK